MNLLERIRQYAVRHDMWRPNTRVIAAVSGGSDSVAMLRLLHELHGRGELQLDAIAHLNHAIRPESAEDQEFCRHLASRLNLPFFSTTVDVPARARAARESIELAARIARRDFLDSLRRERGAACVATAHTEDDQAETVLLRLLRGAGQRGISGIAPSGRARVRPVLCATRAELRSELERRNQTWREDPTNRDVTHPRNRVRHELLPYLEQHFNPSARRALARLADAARADDRLLSRRAAALAALLLAREGDRVCIEGAALQALPEALGRRVAQYALETAGGAPSADDAATVVELACRAGSRDLPRVRAEHFSGNVVLVPRRDSRCQEPFRFALDVPGAVRIDSAGCVVEATGPFELPSPPASASTEIAHVDAEAVGRTLVVRSRRPGDRMRPAGLGGSKKLQDLFVDRKVNRRDRDAVPVVTDTQGRIVWVAGHAVGEAFRVTAGTKAVIILKLRRI